MFSNPRTSFTKIFFFLFSSFASSRSKFVEPHPRLISVSGIKQTNKEREREREHERIAQNNDDENIIVKTRPHNNNLGSVQRD